METQQRQIDWFRDRLGYFTGSMVGELMKKGRSNPFSETSLAYIRKVMFERHMNPEMVSDDLMFGDYLNTTSITTKAMRDGTANEPIARELYAAKTNQTVIEVGSIRDKSCNWFSSSPDGVIMEDNKIIGCIEIKCPQPQKFIEYASVKNFSTLLEIEPKYAYQCISHMMVTGADWCDFIVYNPFVGDLVLSNIYISRINKSDFDFDVIYNRIEEANSLIQEFESNLLFN